MEVNFDSWLFRLMVSNIIMNVNKLRAQLVLVQGDHSSI